jgi:cobalt-zinc-cadmium efflux system membrane fusion protein
MKTADVHVPFGGAGDKQACLRVRRWLKLSMVIPAFPFLLACGEGGAGTEAQAPDEHEGESALGGSGTEVHLDAHALSLSDIELGHATEETAGGLSVTGTITFDQDRVSRVGAKAQGRILNLPAKVGSRVKEGEILAHLESPEVGAIRAEAHEAEALVEISRENHARETRLEAQGISSRRELLEAEAELRRAEAKFQSATERLRVLGADVHGDGGHFDVLSPFAGVVVERAAGRGEVVGTEDDLFTVADLRSLWIELDVYERDLHRATLEQSVGITTEAWPDRIFEGQIVYVADILDTERRTVRARVEVENHDGALKPGMFATATIQSENGHSVVAVPRDAVQTLEGEEVVWVPGEEEGEFFTVLVLLGEELPGDRVEIASGIEPGEVLVIGGAFTLKAELAKGEFGGHAH